MQEALKLETPQEFPSFPFKPYSIQLDLMRALYSAIEDRKVAIIESPTGTGKTLSLLCGSLTWLLHEKGRAKRGQLIDMTSGDASRDPDWVLEQTLERCRRELEDSEREFEERLEKARKKEQQLKDIENARARKRQKLEHHTDPSTTEDGDESSFLPEDEDVFEEGANISPAVRELMQKLAGDKSKLIPHSSAEPTCIKIYYASRTHSQLSQLKAELGKSSYLSIRTVPLASRKNLCINENVRKKADVDEGCRELLNETKKKRCPHLPSIGDESRMLVMRDTILATPKDIEDLFKTGEQLQTCPYFGARYAIPQAELVALPYNLLLQRSAREALGIDLKDQVIVIDEAHNLIDTILSIHTVILSSTLLSTCISQLKTYLAKFRTRLVAQHALHLKRLVGFLVALSKLSQEFKQSDEPKKEIIMTASDLVIRLGTMTEGINLLEIGSYLKRSRIARKVSGYCDKLEERREQKENSNGYMRNKGATPPLYVVEAFILTLTSANEDGRISMTASKDTVLFKYQLLNPGTQFREVVEDARCVILAGGTMSPISDIQSQLFSYLPHDRFSVFSCGHITPKENTLTLVIPKGSAGGVMEFKAASKSNPSQLAELGQTLLNLTNLIPAGMVVFFPSYAFLASVRAYWTESGLMDKLNVKKKVFFEPQQTGEVEETLKDYAAAIQKSIGSKTGALLMAVVGAKLSEGLNFSDDLARSVVLVGLPFPNMGSSELKERMRYVSDLEKRGELPKIIGTKDAGAELYENLAMRAVNQSIGRAIRHRNDWASLILLDTRYSSSGIRSKLPLWLERELIIAPTFGKAVAELSRFYRKQNLSRKA